MNTETEQSSGVRKVFDKWVEIDATPPDEGFAIAPIQLRPGLDDGEIQITNVPGVGAQVKIRDLRQGVRLIEEEAA